MLIKTRKLFSPSPWIIVLLALALSSCNTTESKKGIERIEKKEQTSAGGTREIPKTRGGFPRTRAVTAHFWDYLSEYGKEEEGFATYTYVLIGRDKSHKATWTRYINLIGAITSSTTEKPLAQIADKSLLNLFLIPVVGGEGQDARSPNDKLSIELLTALSTALPGKFEKPGPFLITLYKPIRYGRPGEIANILFVDLSKMNDKTNKEVVRAYKSAVTKSEIKGEEKLQLLLIRILDTAFMVEESYGFVKVAFAELQKAFNTQSE